MIAAPDIKYTDRDVREDPTLTGIATSYVQAYGGEFDPLVRAQNMLAMDGGLTVPMVRTVLNCMRHDHNVASDLPAPRGFVFEVPSYPPVDPPPRLRPEPAPEREPRLLSAGGRPNRWQTYPLRARLKLDYIVNLHPRAELYHRVDHDRFGLTFIPADWPANAWGNGRRNAFVPDEVRAACGMDLTRRMGVTSWLGDLADALDSGLKYCPRCEHGKRDAGWATPNEQLRGV